MVHLRSGMFLVDHDDLVIIPESTRLRLFLRWHVPNQTKEQTYCSELALTLFSLCHDIGILEPANMQKFDEIRSRLESVCTPTDVPHGMTLVGTMFHHPRVFGPFIHFYFHFFHSWKTPGQLKHVRSL